MLDMTTIATNFYFNTLDVEALKLIFFSLDEMMCCRVQVDFLADL